MNIDNIKSAKTKKIGKYIKYYNEIESTHLYAIKHMQDEEDGTIIIAEMQTGGIGTNGRKWYSEENKNIMMSIILKPNKKISNIENLTVRIANCMKQAITDLFGYTLDIKYPNDLLINGKKICGILTRH